MAGTSPAITRTPGYYYENQQLSSRLGKNIPLFRMPKSAL
jgi:hypothetical protein